MNHQNRKSIKHREFVEHTQDTLVILNKENNF